MSEYRRMNPELKTAWLEKLRSGQYTQGRSTLRIDYDSNSKYCCLGVLCEVAVDRGEGQYSGYGNFIILESNQNAWLNASGREWSGVDMHAQDRLMEMNDSAGDSFDTIADWIERNL